MAQAMAGGTGRTPVFSLARRRPCRCRCARIVAAPRHLAADLEREYV